MKKRNENDFYDLLTEASAILKSTYSKCPKRMVEAEQCITRLVEAKLWFEMLQMKQANEVQP